MTAPTPAEVESIEALAAVMIARRGVLPDSMAADNCRRDAAALLASPALADLLARARGEGRLEVGKAVCAWSIKNESAEPPLDWAWLGEIIHWAGADIGDQSDRADRQEQP